jgi:hypothetical protein
MAYSLLAIRYSLVKRPAGETPAGPQEKLSGRDYALKLLPQPQPPVALGLEKVKPDPCIEVT